MMHRYIFLYVIYNKYICASRHSHRIHTPRGLGSHTGPGSQRYIQQHETLHTRSHQTETRGDREMSKEDNNVLEILWQSPTICGRLIFTYIIGVFITIVILSPFKDIDWVYVPAMKYLTASLNLLPAVMVWYLMLCIAVSFFELLTWTGEKVKQYIQEV